MLHQSPSEPNMEKISDTINRVAIQQLKLRCYNPYCRHTWMPRTSVAPLKCPRCQSRHWYDPNYAFSVRHPRTKKEEPCAPTTEATT
jgi:hypothetical protein